LEGRGVLVNLVSWLKELEQGIGFGGNCTHGFNVEWPPEEEKPPSGPEECPDFGLPRVGKLEAEP
jgi:hypothetical protein